MLVVWVWIIGFRGSFPLYCDDDLWCAFLWYAGCGGYVFLLLSVYDNLGDFLLWGGLWGLFLCVGLDSGVCVVLFLSVYDYLGDFLLWRAGWCFISVFSFFHV